MGSLSLATLRKAINCPAGATMEMRHAPINRKLTKRQAEVLGWISEFIRVRGIPPTIREIGAGVGLSSSSSIKAQLDTLTRKGYVTRNKHLARGLVVVGLDGDTLARNGVLAQAQELLEALAEKQGNIEAATLAAQIDQFRRCA
jgi:SOS-response transcriptional repressor LexA